MFTGWADFDVITGRLQNKVISREFATPQTIAFQFYTIYGVTIHTINS